MKHRADKAGSIIRTELLLQRQRLVGRHLQAGDAYCPTGSGFRHFGLRDFLLPELHRTAFIISCLGTERAAAHSAMAAPRAQAAQSLDSESAYQQLRPHETTETEESYRT